MVTIGAKVVGFTAELIIMTNGFTKNLFIFSIY